MAKLKQTLTLQWHVTRSCDQRCKHCYTYSEPSYDLEKYELPLVDCYKVIDDLTATAKEWGVKPRINFSGGDPLLRRGIFELLAYARKYKIDTNIIGNPFHVTLKVARKLKRLGIRGYQISLDGCKKMHDYFRKPGSFDASLKALKILQQAGLHTSVMFTLSRTNADELLKVIDLVVKNGVDRFSFNRLVPIGNGRELRKAVLRPKEYREILIKVLKKFKKLEARGVATKFRRKDALWSLLYYELGLLKMDKRVAPDVICGGCSMGNLQLAVLADGTVYPCRRILMPIGKLPQNKIGDLLLHSPVMKKVRRLNNYKKCKSCKLKQLCRGCPAIAWAVKKDMFAADPQCWKLVKSQAI